MAKQHHYITVTLGEIAEQYQAIRRGDRSRAGVEVIKERKGFGENWIGSSLKDMDRWVANGYTEGTPIEMPDAEAPMAVPEVVFDEEEGDILYSLAVQGDDLYRARWEPMPTPRGVSINAQLYISASVGSEQLNAYAEWLLGVIDGVERQGETPDVNITTAVNTDKGEVFITIPLRRSGEAMDISAWRVLLAPGGYRTLVFLADHIAAERIGAKPGFGLGSDTLRQSAHSWSIRKDEDQNVFIAPPMNLSGLDKDRLTAQVMAAIEA